VYVREGGEHAIRRETGDQRVEQLLLLLRPEGGPRQAADDDVGVRDAAVGEHRAELGGVCLDHRDGWVPGGQSPGQPCVDLDRKLSAPSSEPLLDGCRHHPGARAQLDDDDSCARWDRCDGGAGQRSPAGRDSTDRHGRSEELARDRQVEAPRRRGVLRHRTSRP
jgi:hypothetical protein